MNKIKNRNSLVKPVVGFNGIELVPNVLRGGRAINNGDGTFTFRGRTHKTGGIDVGNIEVEDKEIGKSLSDGGMAILSAHRRFPSLRGVSPAEYYQITGDFDTPFILQETDKQMGRVNNSKRKAAKGALFTPALSVPAFTPIATSINTDTDGTVVTPAVTDATPAATTDNPARHTTKLNPMPIVNIFDIIRGIRNTFSAPKNTIEKITEEAPYYPSENIVRYLKETEAFRPNVYLDGNGVETIGYGTTAATKAGQRAFAKYRKSGMTEQQASDVMHEVIREMVPSFINSTPNFNKLNNNERDALFSYFYNVGIGNYTTKSPGMQKALRDLNREQIMAQMDIGYNDSKNPGLRKRRDKERAIFATPVGTTYENGGIHIDKNKRGTFTAAATKHGMGVQQFASKVLANKENYSPAMVKKANFARNAAKWKASSGGIVSITGNVKNGLIYANGNRVKAPNGIIVGGTYGGGTGGGGGAGTRFPNSNYVAVESNGQTMLIPISVVLGNNNLNGQPIRYIRPNGNTRRIGNTSTLIEGSTPTPIIIESEPEETNVVRNSDNGIINGGQLNDLIVTPQTNGLDYSDPDYGKVKLVNNNGVYSYVPITKENSFDATTPNFLTRPYVSGYRDLRGFDYPARFIPGNTNPATEEVIVEPSINTEEVPVIETARTTPNDVRTITTPSRRVSNATPQASNPSAPVNNNISTQPFVNSQTRTRLATARATTPSLATPPIVPTGNIDLAAINERRATNNTGSLVPQMTGGNSLDYITAGANALGTILGAIGTNMMINKTPKVAKPIFVSGPKFAEVSANSQIDATNRAASKAFDDINHNTASSSVALARKRGVRANALATYNSLIENRDNTNVQIKNQEQIYDYQARNNNANRLAQYYRDVFSRDYNKLNSRISNFNNALSNLSSIGMNLADRIENRRAFNRNLMAIAMSNPNVDARNIFGPDSAFARALGITYVPVKI